MGTGQSKITHETQESKEPPADGLFSWQKLPVPTNEAIHYDPRYEHIAFTDNCFFVSDYHNRIFEWEGRVDADKKPSGYHLKSFLKYEYENASGTQAGKRFDKNATSLTWIRKTIIHFYDIQTEKLYLFDASEWISAKYGENNTAKIPPKSIINLGKGQVLIMVAHYKGTDKSAKDIECGTDIAHLDVINEKEIQTVTIQSDLLRNIKNQCVYWGFKLNPNGNEISVLIQGEKNVTFVCFVSLSDGNILWQTRFDFVHNVLFNDTGTFACIFERPRKTEFGYVHVLNLTRMEWICQVRLTYGTSPLGWDGFTWLENSLVFMAPFELKVVSPGALEWRIAETKKQIEIEKQERQERLRKQRGMEEKEGDDDGADDGDQTQVKEEDKTLTPRKFDAILQQQKSKEICVLSIGERWWDLEKDVMDLIYTKVEDEELSKLILEFSGLKWAMIKFPYPDEEEKNKKDNKNPNAMLLQGAQSEVFECGCYGDYNVLLLAKIARDPRTNNFNHWVFRACTVPKTFGEMWRNEQIQQGTIGQITNVNEESHLKPLDAYK
eukprot:170327_1